MFQMVDHKTPIFSIFSIPSVETSFIIRTKLDGCFEHRIIPFLVVFLQPQSKVKLEKTDGSLTCLLDIYFADM